MKANRIPAWLFLGFLIPGCSENPVPVSSRTPKANQPPATSIPMEPSTVQTSPESSVPPAIAESAPIASAGTEALIEGLNLGGLKEAFVHARSAYDKSPKDPAAATQFINLIEELGISFSQQGNRERGNKAFSKAVELLETALKADVKINSRISSVVYYNGGCAKALENKAEDAMILVEKAMNHGFGDLDQLRGDADLAVVRALPGFSEKLAAWEVKAQEAALEHAKAESIDADRRDKAIKQGEELLTLSRSKFGPEHPSTLLEMSSLAGSYFEAGRLDEELKLREEVLTLHRKVSGPEHFSTFRAMEKLAICYYERGRLDEAVKLREEMLSLFRKLIGPEHPNTLNEMNNLLYLYHAANQQDEAFKLSTELLALTPDDSGAHNEAAWKLATTPDKDGRYPQAKQAVTWARRACELEPTNGALLNTLGVTLYRAEQWQEAGETLQKSIELGADVPHNWLFTAMSHWQLNQKDKAREWYDKSLTWQAANEEAARADAELRGFFAEAAKLMDPDSKGE